MHRGDVIWTRDLLVPNQALYQAEPRPDVKYQNSLDRLYTYVIRNASPKLEKISFKKYLKYEYIYDKI